MSAESPPFTGGVMLKMYEILLYNTRLSCALRVFGLSFILIRKENL